jgi:hypothetical protein
MWVVGLAGHYYYSAFSLSDGALEHLYFVIPYHTTLMLLGHILFRFLSTASAFVYSACIMHHQQLIWYQPHHP